MSRNKLIKGIITIERRDATTMELIETKETENTITNWGKTRFLDNFSFLYGNYPPEMYNRICITGRRFNLGVKSVLHTRDTYGASDVILNGGTFYSGSPAYLEFKGRFNAPASTRTIWGIGIVHNNGSPLHYTFAPLATSCTQTTSEVLDITYRLQEYEFESVATGNMAPISDIAAKAFGRRIVADDVRKIPARLFLSGHKCHNQNMVYRGWGNRRQVSIDRTTDDYRKFRWKWNRAYALNDDVGKVIQSYSIGQSGYYDDQLEGATIFNSFTNDSFVNKPVQPIHNHNTNAIAPFLDVNYLSSCQGNINVNGSAWTDPDFPEFYRLEFTKSGNVGTSRYMLRKRSFVGFSNNTYGADAYGYFVGSFAHNTPSISWQGTPNETLVGMHGSLRESPANCEQYGLSNREVVLFNATGITIQDQINGDSVIFDSTTTPNLSVTGITQLAIEDDGTVWVACRNTGLYKITTPKSSPTITHFTNATHGIPADGGCYGVDIGYNKVWAVFNGGISSTVDGGTSWTNYNPSTGQPFSYTGISDSNWNTVNFIRCDKNSPTDRIGILYKPTATSYNICWWSTSTAASAGPSTSYDTASIPSLYSSFKCSKRKGIWFITMFFSDSASAGSVYTCKFNSITKTLLSTYDPHGEPNWGALRNDYLAIFYDYYNVPHVLYKNKNDGNNVSHYRISRYDGISNMVCGGFLDNGLSREAPGAVGFNFENSDNGIFLKRYYADSRTNPYCQLTPGSYVADGWIDPMTYNMGPNIDSLNGKHTIFEELVNPRIHWNGSAWVKNYYAPAIDSSTYSHNGIRHNFDTESHAFTGRSMIDISNSFTASLFSSTANATFVVTASSLAKRTNRAEEQYAALFSIENNTQIFRVYFDDGSGSFVIKHGSPTALTISSFTTTPPTSSSNRIVVIINGTSLKVFNNGAQIGSTITMPSAFDWTNTSGNLKSYVGCIGYDENQHLESTIPRHFFRGSLTNVQVWNSAWDTADVIADYADITAVTSTEPASNLIARFQLTESLEGTESKATHASYENMIHGLQCKFNASVTNPNLSFIATDYYTFGVVDGIIKDNATTFTFTTYDYLCDSDPNYATFKNGLGSSTVPATGQQVTEAVCFSKTMRSSVYNTVPGHFGRDNSAVGTIMSIQGLSGDGYFEWQFNSAYEHNGFYGLSTAINTDVNSVHIHYGFHTYNGSSSFDIIEINAVRMANIPYLLTDVLKIERVGSTINYYQNNTLIYTSSVSSTGTLYFRYLDGDYGHANGVLNAVVNYTLPANFMFIGNDTLDTGRFDPDFCMIDADQANTVDIRLDSTPVSASSVTTNLMGSITPPNAGQVVIHEEAGWLIFNSADAGKLVTGSVTVLYDRM